AAAYRALGDVDEAVKQYEQITKSGQPAGANTTARLIELARLRIERNLLQGKTDWAEAEEAVCRAEEAVRSAESAKRDAVDVVLLRAQLLAAQNKLEEAQVVLTKAKDGHPGQMEFCTALAEVAERREDWKHAWDLLDEAERQGGNVVDVRLARARFWANRRTAEAGR